MDWMYLFYFLLGAAVFFGARACPRGEWNEEYTSRRQMKILQGISILGVAMHHMAQKTCGSWHPHSFIVHGMDPFLSVGLLFVAVFLFCSGFGLYMRWKTDPDYLRHFLRRRVAPVVIAFYLSEIIYVLVRWAMGEKLTPVKVLIYLAGLKLANFNAWYIIAIVYLYLVFFLAFRLCKKDSTAIALVTFFTLAYTVLGAIIDHNDWWFTGEWWYNSIILFPLGMIFAKHEKRVTAFLKKGYWFWLILSFAAVIGFFRLADFLVNSAWGYYGEWGDPLKVPHRLGCAASQWLTCIAYVAFWFLLLLKVRIDNKLWTLLGVFTLEFYMMHGIFVEMFGFNWLDYAPSLYYIKKVPLYIPVVLACSAVGTVLFSLLWKGCVRLLCGPQALKKEKTAVRRTIDLKKLRKWFLPMLVVLLLGGMYAVLGSGQSEAGRVMNGMAVTLPEGYSCSYKDSRYAVWKYTGSAMKPGPVILDANIRGLKSESFATAEDVLAGCEWLSESEIYINPNGVRMVRGFSPEYADAPERRLYVESKSSVFLICMQEDSQYYDPSDCEKVMQQVADSVKAK